MERLCSYQFRGCNLAKRSHCAIPRKIAEEGVNDPQEWGQKAQSMASRCSWGGRWLGKNEYDYLRSGCPDV